MEEKRTLAPSSEPGSSAQVLKATLIQGTWLLLASCPSCWFAPWGADMHTGTRDKSAWAPCPPAPLAHVLLGFLSIPRVSPWPFQLGGVSVLPGSDTGVLSSAISPLLCFAAGLLMAGVLQNLEKQQKARFVLGDTAEPHDSKTPAKLQPASPTSFGARAARANPDRSRLGGVARRAGSDTEPGMAELPGRVPGLSSTGLTPAAAARRRQRGLEARCPDRPAVPAAARCPPHLAAPHQGLGTPSSPSGPGTWHVQTPNSPMK